MAPVDVSDATKNWLKVGLALKHLKNGLIPFVSQHISALHTSIIRHRGTCYACTTENVLPCPTPGMCRFKNKRCQYHDQADPRKQARLCPTSVCEKVSGDIEYNHMFGRPNWKNTDATKWASDPWEMAKCFLPPGYAGVQSELETDCTAILSLCLNCRPLETAIRTVKGLVEKNRTNRNEVMHSGSQELTATERGAYIQDAIDLLTQYQTPIDPDTQTFIDTLTELNTDGFVVTTDDFSDVIMNAVNAIKQQQETIKDELESGRTAAEEHNNSIENLQAGKVDQETYMKKVKEMDDSLKSIYSKVKLLYESEQKEIRKKMEAIRKDIESMKTDIWKHIQDIENEMKQLQADMEQLKQVQKSEVEKRKHQGKELDEVKSKVAKQEEVVTSHEMDIDVVKSGILTLEGKVEEIQDHSKQQDIQAVNTNKVQKQGRKRLRNHLVNLYKKTCSKMPVAPPKRNMLADIKDHYRKQDMRQVVMPHEPKDDQGDKIAWNGKPEADQELTYRDVFRRKGKACRNIYIKGEAGSGKSVFFQHMVNTWCDIISQNVQNNGQTTDEAGSIIDQSEVQSSQDNELSEPGPAYNDNKYIMLLNQDQLNKVNASFLQKFDFLFHIELRYATEHSKIDSMIKEILLMDNDDLASVFTYILKHEPEKCLVLLDGLDEWAPPKGSPLAPHVTRGLPGRNITTNWTVLTTTRPWKLELIRPESEEMDQLIELSGLTQYSARECIVPIVQYLNNRRNENKSASKCQSDLSTDKLKPFMTLPVLLKQLVCLWFDEGQVRDSQCDIYAGMIDVYLRYSAQRQTNPDSPIRSPSASLPSCLNKRDSCKKYTHQLHSLSKLAFYTLFCEDRESSLVFNSTATEIHGMSEAETDMWLNVGLLSQDIAERATAAEHKQMSFPHKSIQEFLAAVHITGGDDENTLKRISDICTSVEMVMEMSQVFVFVAGMEPTIFTKMSELIAKVVDYERNVQEDKMGLVSKHSHDSEYINCRRLFLKNIEVIQNLVLKCIKESKANQHSDIAIHIHDIILGDYHHDIILGDYHIKNWDHIIIPQLDLIKMNIADVVSLTLIGDSEIASVVPSDICEDVNRRDVVSPTGDVEVNKDIFAHYIYKAFGGASVKSFENLRTILVRNVDIRSADFVIEKYHSTLERVSLEYRFPYYISDSLYDVKKADIHLRGFSQFTNLRAINLSRLKLNYHQIKQILSLTQNTTLREIVLSQLDCSPCTGWCENCCETQFDMSQNTQLQRLELDELKLKEGDSAVTKQVTRAGIKPFVNRNAIRINTAQIVICSITSIEGSRCCSVEFIGTPSPCKNFKLKAVSLHHDELLKIASFVSETTDLRNIHLSKLRCVDCINMCDISLNLPNHTELKTLIVNRVCSVSIPRTYVLFNEMQVNTVQLQKFTIANDNASTMDLRFIGTVEKLTTFNLSAIALTHDQLQGVMSLLTQAKGLEEITLSELCCVDHGNECEWQLDLTTHTALTKFKLDSVHGNCMINDASTNDSESRNHALPALEFIGTAECLYGLFLSNGQQLMPFVTRASLLGSIALSELRCVDCGDIFNYWLYQLKLTRLSLNISHITELKVNTTQLEECTITDDGSNHSTEHCQQYHTLSKFEFIGTTENLFCLSLSKLALKHDQFLNLMSIVTRATRLVDITLSELKCVDCDDTCSYQLELTEHVLLEKLRLNRSHITELKVKIEKLPENTFTGDRLCIYLKYDQLQSLMFSITPTAYWNAEVVILPELTCVEHDDACNGQLELVTNESVQRIKINRLHVNTLKIKAIGPWLEERLYGEEIEENTTVDIVELHATTVRIDTDRLTLDQSRINELILETTHLQYCTITNLGSNDSDSSQCDTALSTFEFIGNGDCLRELDLNDIALKHEQLHGLVSFLTRATNLAPLDNITLSELRCVDHGVSCDCQLNLAEGSSTPIEKIKLYRLHVGILKVASYSPTELYVDIQSVDITEVHANNVQIYTDNLKLDSACVNELKVDTTELVICTITNVSSNDSHHGSTPSTFQFSGKAKHLEYLELRNINLKHDRIQRMISIVTRAKCLRKIILSELKCVDHAQHDSTCGYQLNLLNHKQLKHLELRNINLKHDQFEELMAFVTRTKCLKKLILSELRYIDHADHDGMGKCQLTLVDHEHLQTLEIDTLHVNQVQVNAARLASCKLTNLRSTSIYLFSRDTPASVSLPTDKEKCCKRLVVGNVRLTNEQLDGLVTFVTQNQDRCKISLYEIECSECKEECSRVDKLQQLVEFEKPDDKEMKDDADDDEENDYYFPEYNDGDDADDDDDDNNGGICGDGGGGSGCGSVNGNDGSGGSVGGNAGDNGGGDDGIGGGGSACGGGDDDIVMA